MRLTIDQGPDGPFVSLKPGIEYTMILLDRYVWVQTSEFCRGFHWPRHDNNLLNAADVIGAIFDNNAIVIAEQNGNHHRIIVRFLVYNN